MPDLPIIPPTLPEGFCPTTWQEFVNEAVGKAVAQFSGSGFTVIISQPTQPDPVDRDKLWYDTDVGRLYRFTGGAWVLPHAYEASGDARLWWEGLEADVWAFDGGDGQDPSVSAPAANSGAMWEVDHNYDGRSPMGAGAIVDSDPAKSLAVSENYGSGIYELNDANTGGFGTHVHVYGRMGLANVNDDFLLVQGAVTAPLISGPQILGADAVGLPNPAQALGAGNIGGAPVVGPYLNTGPMQSTTGADITSINVNIVHPVRGGFMIKRTARINYVGS